MPYKEAERRKLYNKTYYEKTKDRFLSSRLANRNQRRREKAAWLKEYKESRPCLDCGLMWPSYVMHFDHLRDKIKPVSEMMQMSLSKIKAEIEKCDLVCGNCHAIRTFSTNGV